MAKRKKILVVDDSDLVAGMMTSALDESGYDTVHAKNGVEGIELAYKEIPDLIIMDVEMPLMQGYQASRLLKHKRGIKDIPILMHTSMTEDRDKYWAISSGADEFVNKDFDNMEIILEHVERLTKHEPFNIDIIKEDAKQISRDRIFELIGTVSDQQLFQATILNMLGDVGRSISSISETVSQTLDLLTKVCQVHLAVILVQYSKQTLAFILPAREVFRPEMEDFLEVCLNDYFNNFPNLNLEDTEQVVLGITDRKDFDKSKTGRKKINSYSHFILKGNGGATIGTLHLGNFANNYFSDLITTNVSIFSQGAGMVIENSILFNQVSEMKDKIKNVFTKFVPSEVIDELVEKQTDRDLLIGEKREVAILFSDIRSFTTISENNTAEKVVSFLNNFFNVMVGVIEKYGGTIDKFIGDAILAIFGAPVSYEDNAVRACMAAAQMSQVLKTVDVSDLVMPEEGLNIGIGVHEGAVIVGNIGSMDKFDYTVVGDTVNLAARLEGLTKHYHERILVSDSFKGKVEHVVFLREVDTVKVKGKAKPTTMYALEMTSENFDEVFMKHYSNGLKMYKMGNWNTALEYFNEAMKIIPDDFLTNMYILRCQRFNEEPPDTWDGSITLDFK